MGITPPPEPVVILILSGTDKGLLLRTIACVVALAALPASVPGQVLSFSVKSDLVVFSATAVDGKGRPVTNLRREDFRVYDEGRARPIAHFHGGLGLPAGS